MRILIIEDHLFVREAVRKICTVELGHTIVAETRSGEEGIQLTLAHQPDLLILDLSLPDITGIEVVERLHEAKCRARILILSSHTEDYTLTLVEKAGVNGFVDKTAGSLEIIGEALKAIEAGRCYYSAEFERVRQVRHDNPLAVSKILSDHEQKILHLIGLGRTDAEIGDELNISDRTAQTHRSRILRRLEIPTTPKLMHFTAVNGITGFAQASSDSPRKKQT